MSNTGFKIKLDKTWNSNSELMFSWCHFKSQTHINTHIPSSPSDQRILDDRTQTGEHPFLHLPPDPSTCSRDVCDTAMSRECWDRGRVSEDRVRGILHLHRAVRETRVRQPSSSSCTSCSSCSCRSHPLQTPATTSWWRHTATGTGCTLNYSSSLCLLLVLFIQRLRPVTVWGMLFQTLKKYEVFEFDIF